jgi:hypothetical protein
MGILLGPVYCTERFLQIAMSRPALGPTKFRIHWLPRADSLGV